MKLVACVLAALCSACFTVPLRDLEADVFYDARGKLGYCRVGDVVIESATPGEFEELLDRNWLVTEVEPLADGTGFVFAARRNAPPYGGLLDREDTTELWLRENATRQVRRLTNDVAHEDKLVALPDSSGVVYEREEAGQRGGFVAPDYDVVRLDFASGASARVLPAEPRHSFWIVGTVVPANALVIETQVRIETPAPEGRIAVSYVRQTQFVDVVSGEVGMRDATHGWRAVDLQGRTSAWLTATTSPGGSTRRYVVWLDRASGKQTWIRTADDLPQIAISPDGERIAVLERDCYGFGIFIGFSWETARIREFDRSGRMLREIEL